MLKKTALITLLILCMTVTVVRVHLVAATSPTPHENTANTQTQETAARSVSDGLEAASDSGLQASGTASQETTEPVAHAVYVAKEVEKVIEKTIPVCGRILMPDGTLAKNGRVECHRGSGSGFMTAGKDGEFSFEISLLHSTYLIFYAYGQEEHKSLVSDPVVVEVNGNPIEVDLALREAYPVAGTLRYRDEAPAVEQWVWFIRTLESAGDKGNDRIQPQLKRSRVTDAEGKYTIYLTPGEYEVHANHDIRAGFGKPDPLTKITVKPDEEINLDFTISDTLFLRLLRTDGTPVFPSGKVTYSNLSLMYYSDEPIPGKRTIIGEMPGVWGNEDGNIQVWPLQVYETTLLLMTDDGKEAITCRIPKDRKNLEIVEIPLVPTAQVKFRLIDEETGEPIAGRTLKNPVAAVFPSERYSYLCPRDYTTDSNGGVTFHVPTFGDCEGWKYYLDVRNETTSSMVTPYPVDRPVITFVPEKPGDVIDLGDVKIERVTDKEQ